MLGRAYKVLGGRPYPYGLINVVRSGTNIKIVGRFLVGCYDPADEVPEPWWGEEVRSRRLKKEFLRRRWCER